MYRLGSVNTGGPLNAENPNGKILLAALARRGYVLLALADEVIE